MNASLFTYGLAGTAYLSLSVLLLTQWRVKPLGPGLLLATAATACWASIIAMGTLYEYPPVTLIQIAELIRNSAWIFLLLQLLGFQQGGNIWQWRDRRWIPRFAALSMLGCSVISLRPLSVDTSSLIFSSTDLTLILWLAYAIVGLLLIEQTYRNAAGAERWGLKFLCLGLGAVFSYDFFMYAEALLLGQLNGALWQARGFVSALVVPWLAIAIARNRHWRINMYVSRHVVFHTVTLAGAGIYLLGMGVIGYFIRYLGGNWGGVLQIGFLSLAGIMLITLLFSANLRARLRVYLSKHFFSYRYDYREEWLRFTEGLASLTRDRSASGIIEAMAPISLSKSGILIHRDSAGSLSAHAGWETDDEPGLDLGNVPDWVQATGWVIDLVEWKRTPDLYDELQLPNWLRDHETIWLVVPLVFQNELEGLLFLFRTELKSSLNWEDRDLLKTAGRQAAALLAQQRASTALVEARQFDAFNRLSAYVVHDLKNILAQQSLMVSNAKKHRDNPAFVGDMIGTVENSVNRMQRLMDQMRSGLRDAESSMVQLGPLLKSCSQTRSNSLPRPTLSISDTAVVTADRERLATVFSHLLQNAQEATPDDGAVTIGLEKSEGQAQITITDTGSGMSDNFIRDRLFKPFESTKGLTGMGIGAFESREYVRQLGGDIAVKSSEGQGSQFLVSIPLADLN